MKTLYCPKCGTVSDGQNEDHLDDTAELRCPECSFAYHVADGQIWTTTTTHVLTNINAYVSGIISHNGLCPEAFKAEIIKTLREWGWGGDLLAWSQPPPVPYTELIDKAMEKLFPNRQFSDLTNVEQADVLTSAKELKEEQNGVKGKRVRVMHNFPPRRIKSI